MPTGAGCRWCGSRRTYAFEGPGGAVGLLDLFEGRRQLFVQHFMFDPSWDDGCPSCSAGADELSAGLSSTCTSATRRSRRSRAHRSRRSRTTASARAGRFPWYSSFGSDFNYDFHATIDESVAPLEINYRSREQIEALAASPANGCSRPSSRSRCRASAASSATATSIFHTYSTFARGTEAIGGAYGFLDLTALGRQEEWEEPKGRAENARGAMPNFASLRFRRESPGLG